VSIQLTSWFPKLAARRRQLRYWPPFSLILAAPDSFLWSHSNPRGDVISAAGWLPISGSENGSLSRPDTSNAWLHTHHVRYYGRTVNIGSAWFVIQYRSCLTQRPTSGIKLTVSSPSECNSRRVCGRPFSVNSQTCLPSTHLSRHLVRSVAGLVL
jgi:hypothetical protein